MESVRAGPKSVGRYQLLSKIASGGMGSVYLARLRGEGGFQRFCALKCLHPHLAEEPEAIAMFLDEARIAAGIHHPNVVSVLDLGQEQGAHFVAMELVEGASLGELIEAAGAIPAPIAVRLVLDALAGLEAAHRATDEHGAPLSIVHRDVSPHNVLVGLDGRARLTDFGIARAAARLRETRGFELKGKLPYMAPEQLRGKPVDHRADVFGMGLVLWEALTGRMLFDSADRSALDDAASPAFSTGCGAALDAVILHALAGEREARFLSAAAFAEALTAAATASVGIASSSDAAALVERAFGTRARQRRSAVDPTLEFSLAKPAAGADPQQASPITADIPSLGVWSPPAVTPPLGIDRRSGERAEQEREREEALGDHAPSSASRRRWLLGGLLLGSAALATAAYASFRPNVHNTPIPPASSAASPSASASNPSSESASASPSTEPPPDPSPVASSIASAAASSGKVGKSRAPAIAPRKHRPARDSASTPKGSPDDPYGGRR